MHIYLAVLAMPQAAKFKLLKLRQSIQSFKLDEFFYFILTVCTFCPVFLMIFTGPFSFWLQCLVRWLALIETPAVVSLSL